jgi:hypothetical protein
VETPSSSGIAHGVNLGAEQAVTAVHIRCAHNGGRADSRRCIPSVHREWASEGCEL